MVQVYKIEWVNSSLLPKLVEALDREATYLLRISALHSLKFLYLATPAEYSSEKIFPLVLKGCKDPQSNVRMTAARTAVEVLKLGIPENLAGQLRTSFFHWIQSGARNVFWLRQRCSEHCEWCNCQWLQVSKIRNYLKGRISCSEPWLLLIRIISSFGAFYAGFDSHLGGFLQLSWSLSSLANGCSPNRPAKASPSPPKTLLLGRFSNDLKLFRPRNSPLDSSSLVALPLSLIDRMLLC